MTNMVVFKTTPALLCKLTFIFGMHATGFKQIHSYFTPKIKKETIKVMFNNSNVVFTEPIKKKNSSGFKLCNTSVETRYESGNHRY